VSDPQIKPYWPGLPADQEIAALVSGYTDDELAAHLRDATPGTEWHRVLSDETANREGLV
jgi:hypothetical protein